MKIIVYLFLLIGITSVLLNKTLHKTYIGLLLFFLCKMIFNYRNCTLSYVECKLRGVKREQGYLNNFMDGIINLRETNECVLYYIYALLILYYHFIQKNNKLQF